MSGPVDPKRSDWLASSRKRHRESFTELDALLHALGRLFTGENLLGARDDTANRSFSPELSAARDTMARIVDLLDTIIPDNRKNEYWFLKFAQAKYLSDSKRDALREDLYRQDMPEKSLFLLYDTMVNLKGIVTDILKAEHLPYLTFTNLGQITERELRENAFFSPFKRELATEFDIIENQTVADVVKAIKDKETRKYTSLIMLYLFRMLRYLRYAETSARSGSLSAALLILLLVRSESARFMGHLDSIMERVRDESLRMTLRALGYQFSMENRRVFVQELRDVFGNRSHQYLKGRIENSHGILKNLMEQAVVQVAQFFDPDLTGDEIFETFVTRLECSLRLREDVLVLYRLLKLFDEAHSSPMRLRVFDSMKNFMLYFQSFTFKLLRHDDYEEFSSFFSKVLPLDREKAAEEDCGALRDTIRHFTVFVGTCLSQINNRAELADTPVDMGRVENSLKQYLQ